jgi:two-component system, NtrC family, response regulator HydG
MEIRRGSSSGYQREEAIAHETGYCRPMTEADLDLTKKNPPAKPSASAYRIVVASGPNAGASIVVDQNGVDRSLVGTSPTSHLRLTDPHVSRRHVVLEPTAAGLSVLDIGSTNGTSINGVRIREALVGVGAQIAIGDTVPATEQAPTLPEADSFGRMVGASRSSRRLFALGQHLATTAVPVLVEGEAGTGKALFAETLHEASARAGGPFIIFDVASVPANRAAALLFDPNGLWERAAGGTLFVAEPALLPNDVQRRLVRLVEGKERGPAAVRLVVGSRTDLDTAVEDGRVREDFFHAFVGGRVAIAPLRTRRDDVDALARHFWKELGGQGEIPPGLLERLRAHAWPGNVRELESVVARHAVAGEIAAPAHMESTEHDGGFIDRLLDRSLPITQARELLIEHFERRYVTRVLERYAQVGEAAAAAGLAPRYFRTLKAKYGYGTK